MNYDKFYGTPVSREFGQYGAGYTIVPNRHIGADWPLAGGTVVPALRAGRVVQVVKTVTMSWGVVMDIGGGLYVSYWHLSANGLPTRGDYIGLGGPVGRIARGYVSYSNPEYAGSLWLGPHTHIVVSTNPYSAYTQVSGHRTLSAFRDPEKYIVRGGASAGGSTDDGNASAPVTPKPQLGEGQMREYYRHNQTKEVAVVTGREMVSVGYDDLAVLLKIDTINHERNPHVYPKPPVLDKPDTYFGVNEDGWAILKALYPYRARS